MVDPHILKTARLTLRSPQVEDAEAVVSGLGDTSVARWLGNLPHPYTLGDAVEFIESSAQKRGKIWHVHDDTGLVGGCAADHELGYWVSKGSWGKGYATEIADAVVDHWFADPNAPDLSSGYHKGNTASANVLKKVGFGLTGDVQKVANPLQGGTIASHKMVLSRDKWRKMREFRLQTDRLTLRELRPEDWPEVQRIGGHPDVAPMLWAAKSPWPKEEVQRWIEAQRFRGRSGFLVAICLDHRLIGTAYFGAAPGQSTPTMAYFIDPNHWGQGYATEAMRGFLTHAMTHFQTPTLWADHFEDNPASGAVLRKLGFIEIKRGIGESAARVEPAAVVIYRLDIANLKVDP